MEFLVLMLKLAFIFYFGFAIKWLLWLLFCIRHES